MRVLVLAALLAAGLAPLTIASGNQAPVVDPILIYHVPATQIIRLDVPAHDPDGDVLTYSATGMPAGATLNSSTGAFEWRPASDQLGTFLFSFEASDGQLTGSGPANITIVPPSPTPITLTLTLASSSPTLTESLHGVVRATWWEGTPVDGQTVTLTQTPASPLGRLSSSMTCMLVAGACTFDFGNDPLARLPGTHTLGARLPYGLRPVNTYQPYRVNVGA